MRRLFWVVALIVPMTAGIAAADDARSEMAEALAAQVDAHPIPAALPVANAASHVAQTPAAKHIPAHAAVISGRRASEQAQQGQGPAAAALAHQAQAATMSAAGQAQAQAARERHSHPHH